MKLNKYVVLSLITVASLAMAQPVLAAEATQEQELEQECKVVCEVGAYGQNSTCTNKCYQKGTQKQTITLNSGTVIKPHQPINTGLDMSTSSAIASLVMTGALATITRRKLI
jgi:hypothetical protein